LKRITKITIIGLLLLVFLGGCARKKDLQTCCTECLSKSKANQKKCSEAAISRECREILEKANYNSVNKCALLLSASGKEEAQKPPQYETEEAPPAEEIPVEEQARPQQPERHRVPSSPEFKTGERYVEIPDDALFPFADRLSGEEQKRQNCRVPFALVEKGMRCCNGKLYDGSKGDACCAGGKAYREEGYYPEGLLVNGTDACYISGDQENMQKPDWGVVHEGISCEGTPWFEMIPQKDNLDFDIIAIVIDSNNYTCAGFNQYFKYNNELYKRHIPMAVPKDKPNLCLPPGYQWQGINTDPLEMTAEISEKFTYSDQTHACVDDHDTFASSVKLCPKEGLGKNASCNNKCGMFRADYYKKPGTKPELWGYVCCSNSEACIKFKEDAEGVPSIPFIGEAGEEWEGQKYFPIKGL